MGGLTAGTAHQHWGEPHVLWVKPVICVWAACRMWVAGNNMFEGLQPKQAKPTRHSARNFAARRSNTRALRSKNSSRIRWESVAALNWLACTVLQTKLCEAKLIGACHVLGIAMLP